MRDDATWGERAQTWAAPAQEADEFQEQLASLCDGLRAQADATEHLARATVRLGAVLSRVGTGEGPDSVELDDALRVQSECFARARAAEGRVRAARRALQTLTGLERCTVPGLREYAGSAPGDRAGRAHELLERIAAELERLRTLTDELAQVTAGVADGANAGLELLGGRTRQLTRGRYAAHAYAGTGSTQAARPAFFIDKRE